MASVHLVGSVPLTSSEEVFRSCCQEMGSHLKRLPDGETGDRSNWISWQRAVFESTPQLHADGEGPLWPFRLEGGARAEDVVFPDLGYAEAARTSFADFQRLKSQGNIPPGMRFQVSLPTPLAPVQLYFAQECKAALEPVYERALLNELEEILAAIPGRELSIQWDTAVEFGVLEGVFPAFFDDPFDAVIARLIRLGDRVPEEVELGYHLCYGDAGHQHFVEPADTTWLVRVANGLASGVNRHLHWIHLPVPKSRHDEAYYLPLKELSLSPNTELYLGLLHASDGLEGALARIKAAQSCVDGFGVATECGFGRRSPDSLPPLMALHVQASKSL